MTGFVLATLGCSGENTDSSASGGASVTGGAAATGGASSASGGASAAAGGQTGSSTGGSSGTGSLGCPSTSLVGADFESRSEGIYSQTMAAEDFSASLIWNNGLDEGRVVVVREDGGQFLRVSYPVGEVGPAGGGAQFPVSLGGSFEELYASYRIRFAAGFDFVLGGKIPGLCGGSCQTGGGGAPLDGFSARGMWRAGGAAVQYMYYPLQTGNYGEDFDWDLTGTQVAFEAGTWHTVVHHIVMNEAGSANGLVEAWLDGVRVLQRGDVMLRPTGQSYGIDTFYFSTFFGGSTADWAPTKDEVVDFDDFIVCTGPIQ